MKKIYNLYLLMAIMVVAIACKNDPDEEPQVPVPFEETIGLFMDTASLEMILRQIDEHIPTWEQLERFTDNAVRLPAPAFEKRASFWADPNGEPVEENPEVDYITLLLQEHDRLVNEFGANESSALFSSMPPYFGPGGGEVVVPYPLDILDQKLRATTVLSLFEKSKGLPVTLVNFYPPTIELPTFITQDEFNIWFEGRYLPEKEAEAKAAELMKAEKYIAWPLEFELLVTEFGGIDKGGFLDGKSSDEILTFANSLKTKIFNTVKPHYNGNILAHIHNNYQREGFEFWDQMTYSEFDEIHFSFFPPFDVEGTEAYMDALLPHIMKIVENSGNLPWYAGDVSVFEWYVEDGKMEEYEKVMYEAAFKKLELAQIPPKGIAAAAGYMKTQAARDYLKAFFDQH